MNIPEIESIIATSETPEVTRWINKLKGLNNYLKEMATYIKERMESVKADMESQPGVFNALSITEITTEMDNIQTIIDSLSV